MTILYIVLAIVILLFMVLVHEFGHYCIGRMLHFKITEFSIGFGKAIFSRKNKRGELISLRLFPLGGYCAFAGEEETDCDAKDAFTNQKPWKRILVFLAGITFNFATAVIFSMILLCTVGYDIPKIQNVQLDTTKIEAYVEDSIVYSSVPEEKSLKNGDVVISINGKKIDFAYGVTFNDEIKEQLSILTSSIKKAIKQNLGEREAFLNAQFFPALVRRGGEYVDVEIGFSQYQILTQAKDSDGKLLYDEFNKPIMETQYRYSIAPTITAYVHSFGEAIERAVPFAFGLAWTVLKSLWLLITFQLPISDIGGPITAIATIAQYTQTNFANILILIPLISANLAIFNLLPIPALDGAHVLFTSFEAIRKKPIKREVENMIHTIGLFILFGLVIIIDILHFLL